MQKILLEGVQLWQCFNVVVFLNIFYEGWEEWITPVIIGSPAKHHLNGVLLVYWWWPNIECWLGSFMIYQGIKSAPELQKTLYFCDFSRGVQTPCPPSRSAYELHDALPSSRF